MSEYRIKKVSNEMLIRELNERIFPSDPIHKYSDDVTHSWILLAEDNSYAGFLSLKVTGKTGILTRVGITVNHRGKKLQIKLMKHMHKYAKNNGLERIVTHVKHDNIPSFKNLLKAGYNPYKPKKPYNEPNIVYLKISLIK